MGITPAPSYANLFMAKIDKLCQDQTSLIFIHACGRVKLVKIACTLNSYYLIKWHYSSKELSDHSVLKVLVHSTVTICYTKLHIWIKLSLNSISYQKNHLPNPKSPVDNVHASSWKREVCVWLPISPSLHHYTVMQKNHEN